MVTSSTSSVEHADMITTADNESKCLRLVKFSGFLYASIILISSLVFLASSVTYADTTVTGGASESAIESTLSEVPLSPEAIRDMVSRLSDKEVRSLLLDRLDAVAKARESELADTDQPASGVVGFVSFWAAGVADSVSTSLLVFPNMLQAQSDSVRTFVTKRGTSGTMHVLGILVFAIALGIAVEWLVRTLTQKWREKIANPTNPDSFKESFQLLSMRFLLDLVGVVAFAIVAANVISRMPEQADSEFFRVLVFRLIVFPRIMIASMRFLYAPERPDLRLVHTDDWTANFTYKHSWGLFVLMGLGSVVVGFNLLNGIPIGVVRVGFWFALLTHLYFIYIAWRTRDGLSKMLMGKNNDVTPMEARIARIYPYFVIAVTVLLWLVVELIISLRAFHLILNQPHIVTMLILLFIPAMDTFIRSVVANMVPPMQGEGVIAERAYHSTKRSYLRIGRIIVFGMLVAALVDIWQIQLHTVASDAVGATVASNVIRLLIILTIGYFIWEVVTLFINRKLAAEYTAAGFDITSEEPGGGEGGGTGASRLSTILPLLRFTLQTIVVSMTLLISLSNIGINVTPLLAGAGVVGIAVGFGAQKLVADVVSGIFFLIDDAFRAGEYISIDGTVGTVEKISLRSMQLRHHRGAVHTIPYGEIPKLTNFSRDWVLMKLKFTVPFDTDLKLTKKIFKKIGSEVVDLPQFSDDLLQPFKFQGALEVNDVGIVIGGKFMAKPGTQFMMRKELFLRVQKEFDANGIQFARKEVRVKLDGEVPEHLEPDQVSQITGAAAAAIDEKLEEDPAKKK